MSCTVGSTKGVVIGLLEVSAGLSGPSTTCLSVPDDPGNHLGKFEKNRKFKIFQDFQGSGARLGEAAREPADQDVYLYSGVSICLVVANHF